LLAKVWAAVKVLFFLYLFLCAISLMGTGFKMLGGVEGKDVSGGPLGWFFEIAKNPFVGLFTGILVTSIVQSSSVTTSTVVALVAGGGLDVSLAVPMVMGANIGTSVTSFIVSLAHVRHRPEFRRAYSAACVHDFFNIMAVMILLPLELATGLLQRLAKLAGQGISMCFVKTDPKAWSPIEWTVKPVVKTAVKWAEGVNPFESEIPLAFFFVLVSLALIFFALARMTGIMKGVLMPQLEGLLDGVLLKRAIPAMVLGCVVTALVQSSSVTTSLMVPLVAAGVVSLRKVFPFVLGANVGTTVTALIAACAVTGDRAAAGLQIALVHLFFNLLGILIIFGIKPLRAIPLTLAGALSTAVARRRALALAYIGSVFFALPLGLILVYYLAR
jgi:sodium-dependent phosphate cotransporter